MFGYFHKYSAIRKSYTIKTLISNIFLYSYVLPLVVILALLLLQKIKRTTLITTLLMYLVILFFLNFFYTEISGLMKVKTYYFTYTFVEYTLFSVLLFHIIREKLFGKIIIRCSILFTVFMIISYSLTTMKRIDAVPIGVSTILLFVFIFYYFFKSLKETENPHLYNTPAFWFIIGIMLYLGSTFFFNILANNINTHFLTTYWHFTFLGDIIKNIFFAAGVLLYLKQPMEKKAKNRTIDFLLHME